MFNCTLRRIYSSQIVPDPSSTCLDENRDGRFGNCSITQWHGKIGRRWQSFDGSKSVLEIMGLQNTRKILREHNNNTQDLTYLGKISLSFSVFMSVLWCYSSPIDSGEYWSWLYASNWSWIFVNKVTKMRSIKAWCVPRTVFVCRTSSKQVVKVTLFGMSDSAYWRIH